jgi:D-3-phosphoglycerate dehydrogenase
VVERIIGYLDPLSCWLLFSWVGKQFMLRPTVVDLGRIPAGGAVRGTIDRAGGARILIIDPLHVETMDRLSRMHEVKYLPRLTADNLAELVVWPDVLVVRSGHAIDGALLDRAKRLSLVVRAGAGADNLDLDWARQLGIAACNVPNASAASVAEHTIALLLAASRRLREAFLGARKEDLIGTELSGRTLAIVGYGAIGAKVGQLARAFGMHVAAVAREWPPERLSKVRACGVEPMSLAEAFKVADAVSIHLPLVPETRGLVGSELLSRLHGGLVVNVGRSGVLCHKALLAALEAGNVLAAASDVVDANDTSEALAQHPRFVATPHIGAMTDQAQRRVGLAVEEALAAFLAGDPLPNSLFEPTNSKGAACA